jgi:hypothetical protein
MPLFVNVTVCGTLAVPSVTNGNVSTAGVSVTAGASAGVVVVVVVVGVGAVEE